MNWRSRSSDRPNPTEDKAAFRPNRRFLRPASRSRRPRSLGRIVALSGLRIWLSVEVAVLLAAALLLGQIVWRHVPRPLHLAYFEVAHLKVEGNRRVSTATIIDSLGLPARASILEVDLKDLATRIMRNPWIKTASVSRRLPTTLFIQVSERAPRTVVLADRVYLVSDDGLILKEAGPGEMSDFPILRVRVPHPLGVGGRIEISRLEQGARLWRQIHLSPLGTGLQAREIRLEDDGSWTVLLGSGTPFLRFREDGLRWQLDRLAKVLQMRGVGLHEIEYADLRFADKVIVKPRPKGGEA